MKSSKNTYKPDYQKIYSKDQNISPSREEIQRILFERRERFKELNAINKTNAILKEYKPISEMLSEIVAILPLSMQFPEHTVARIKYGDKSFISGSNFRKTQWVLRNTLETIYGNEGVIEIYYLKKFPDADDGPFLLEEKHLINNLSSIISGHLNTIIGKDLLRKTSKKEKEEAKKHSISIAHAPVSKSRQLLQKFIKESNSDHDIYHDLMQFKVKEVLLFSNLYDAFIIEQEGKFFEQVSGEYIQLNLLAATRITGVSTPEEALEKLQEKDFDLVIIMMGLDKKVPIQLSKIIKQIYHNLPVFLMLNNNTDIALFEDTGNKIESIDKIFVWNGDSNIFLAMVKYLEDMINVENDTAVGMVKVVLLVEDSVKYYSRYLPVLYSIVVEQTMQLIEEVNVDEPYNILKMRTRPKILLVSTYEEAITMFNKYKDNLLCLISDVKFERKGKMDEEAGINLLKYAKSVMPHLPAVLQSSELENSQKAYEQRVTFINKNSETLKQDLRSFINYYLGYGNFVYKDETGRKDLAVARSMKEFQKHLKTIPAKSLIYHSRKNHFSHWLMARGEIQIAKKIKSINADDFESPEKLRQFLIDVIEKYIHDKSKGKVVSFEEAALLDVSNIVRMAPGTLGGKGRGLAFINMLVNNFEFNELVPEINIASPQTTIIGTEEFERFLYNNKLYDKVYNETDFNKIKKLFLVGCLSDSLIKKLKLYLNIVKEPLAIRSSSLFEDSLMQPFAGIFDTFLLPNNHENLEVRLEQTMNAIKMVFASIFSPTAQAYFKAVNYKIEEEKMAIAIQKVVGQRYENYFYPHISGVAQSVNFYPYSYMKPDEGYAVAGFGLGKYVVEGEKSFRFSPVHPQLEIYTPKELHKNSQVQFYAIDLSKKNINIMDGEDAGLIKLDIDEAEKHNTLKHCAGVYDMSNERTIPGLTDPGPRVINFANILKYNYIPLAKTLEVILNIVSEAMGTPIEIEFAVDLTKDKKGRASFYLLQIKPLIKKAVETDINIDDIDNKRLLLYSENGLGNGYVTGLYDVIYVDSETFDNLKTEKMRDEVELLNEKMVNENRKYILIGPGRWGTRDKFIGIPVRWAQISNARIIVEISMEDFPLDASLGSHFFHNLISMNVGYFSVKHNGLIDFINWEKLKEAKVVNQTKHFKHVRFDEPLEIIMDGKKRTSLIYFQ